MMTDLRPDLPELPRRMRKLPIDDRGFPVPAFVANIDGEWDFRVVKPGYIARAYNKKLCWLCGEPMGVHAVFVVGPMCVVNRVSAEPPSHLDCARFAAKACPFLTRPMAKRNEKDLPEDGVVAGTMIERNPGCCALVNTRTWKPFRVDNGVLFEFKEPFSIEWWANGREAEPNEITESIVTGFPILLKTAEDEGMNAVLGLMAHLDKAKSHMPPAAMFEIERQLNAR